MPIKIRLRRMGRKKQAHYRIVVADTTSPRDGRFVESLGYYKPLTHPARVVLDMERVDYWVGQGAQTSETVSTILKKVRKGGDETLAVGEVDQDAVKLAAQEALAAKRRVEAEAASQAAEAEAKKAAAAAAKSAAAAAKSAKEEAPAEEAEAEAAAEPAAEAEEAPPAKAEEAPAAKAKKAPAAKAKKAPAAKAEEAPAEPVAAEAEEAEASEEAKEKSE
jgi:small subunit ribosomal protein S16